jgi:hypothetical protein
MGLGHDTMPRRLEIAFAGVQVAWVFILPVLEDQGVPGEFQKAQPAQHPSHEARTRPARLPPDVAPLDARRVVRPDHLRRRGTGEAVGPQRPSVRLALHEHYLVGEPVRPLPVGAQGLPLCW